MALKSGYTKDIDNKCEIDLEITKNVLKKTLAELLYGDIKEYNKDRITNRIIACIVVDEDGYYECLLSADEVEDKKLHIWWMFVNTAWERSTIKDETELALSDDDAHTAYARDEHVSFGREAG